MTSLDEIRLRFMALERAISQSPDEERKLVLTHLRSWIDLFSKIQGLHATNDLTLTELDVLILALRNYNRTVGMSGSLSIFAEITNVADILEQFAIPLAEQEGRSHSATVRAGRHVSVDSYEEMFERIRADMEALLRTMKQSEEPVGTIGGVDIYKEKLTYRLDIFIFAIEVKLSAPIGMLKRLAETILKTIKDAVSWLKEQVAVQRIIRINTLDQLLRAVHRFLRSMVLIERAEAVLANPTEASDADTSEIVSELIRQGQRPPLALARRARRLTLDDAGLVDLNNIVDCTNVEIVNLDQNRDLFDCEPLARLRKLRGVQLSDTAVASLTWCSLLDNLQHVDLRGTNVSDLAPISKLRLRSLNLRATQVTTLTHLADMGTLAQLNISVTGVTCLRALIGLAQLTTLDLRELKSVDYNELGSIKGLKELDISRTDCKILNFVKDLNQLTTLRVAGAPIVEFSPLVQHLSFRHLHISSDQLLVCQTQLRESRITLHLPGGTLILP